MRELLARQAELLLGLRSEPNGKIPPGLLPLLVELREFAPALAEARSSAESTGVPEERRREAFADALLKHATTLPGGTSSLASEVLLKALDDGRCLLALDGLDEVEMSLRRDVRLAAGALLERCPAQRVLVTCRSHSYVGDAIFPGFDRYEILPLDEGRIQLFAHAWYRGQGGLPSAVKKNGGEDLAQRATKPDLLEMAANPMLLTTMALVHQEGDHRLPDEKAVLYDLAIRILALRWQQRKGPSAWPDEDLREKLADSPRLLRTLERLGFDAHRIRSESGQEEGQGELTRGFLINELEKEDRLGSVDLAERFLGYLDQRAGLLLGTGAPFHRPPSYAFAHQSFQEYLAGRFLATGPGRFRRFREQAGEEGFWLEPARWGWEDLLYRQRDEELFLALLQYLNPEDSPEDEDPGFWRGLLWSGLMTLEAGKDRLARANLTSHGIRLRQRLQWAATSSPLPGQERVEAGRLLGVLGEPDDALTDIDRLELCRVPPGRFWFSGLAEERDEDLRRGGRMEIPYGYWIGRFPVTQGQFGAFVEAGGYRDRSFWPEAEKARVWRGGKIVLEWAKETRTAPRELGTPFDLPNHPVVGITWYEALAFCRWLSRRAREKGWIPAGWSFCLPSEAEWEQGARGGERVPAAPEVRRLKDGFQAEGGKEEEGDTVPNPEERRPYPWGSEDPEGRGNFAGAAGSTSRPGTFPAGASPVGCEELAGNVWEWSRSLYEGDRTGKLEGEDLEAAARAELAAAAGEGRWLTGSAYYINSSSAGCAARYWNFPVNGNLDFGFRVVLLPSTLDSENSEYLEL